jgi:arginase
MDYLKMNLNKINIIGVPFNSDGTTPDLENPPQGLRDSGLIESLTDLGVRVIDNGDLDILPGDGIVDIDSGILNFNSLLKTTQTLSSKIINTWENESFQLILGGDCAILIGIFDAISKMGKNIGLAFFDGHADFHSVETSPTYEAADFELAILTGRGKYGIKRLSNKFPLLKDNEIVAFGLSELDLIEESKIKFYTVDDLREKGTGKCINQGLYKFINYIPIWLHFDVDVIDPKEMPVLIPTEYGLTFKETEDFLRTIFKEYNICGMSISCYHPNLDKNHKLGRKIVSLLKSIKTY